jgi:hypothetical protein
MPKYVIIVLIYVIIVLIIVIGTFIIMNYWSKLKETTKNKIIASIFAIISIGFMVLISLLIF